jgi:hypothetical protein
LYFNSASVYQDAAPPDRESGREVDHETPVDATWTQMVREWDFHGDNWRDLPMAEQYFGGASQACDFRVRIYVYVYNIYMSSADLFRETKDRTDK